MRVKPPLPELNLDHPLAKGLIVAVPFWERGGVTNGTTLSQLAPGKYKPTVTLDNSAGNPAWKNIEHGYGIDLDSTSDNRVTVGGHGTWDVPSGIFSIYAIIQPVITGSRMALVQSNDWTTSGKRSFGVSVDADGTLQMAVWVGGTENSMNATTVLSSWETHAVVFTTDGSTAKIFLDGVEDGSAVIGRANNDDGPLHIGVNVYDNGASIAAVFEGVISDVRIWKDRVLSPQEVAELAVDPWALYQPVEDAVAGTAGGGTVSFVATASCSSTATANLSKLVSLAATATGASTATANLSRSVGLASSASGAATSTSALSRIAGLSATADGSSTAASKASVLRGLQASASGSTTTTADLSVLGTVSFQAVAVCSSTATSDLTKLVGLKASASGSSSATADMTLSGTVSFQAAAVCSSSATAAMSRLLGLDAQANGVTSAVAAVGVLLALKAAASGSSTATAAMTIDFIPSATTTNIAGRLYTLVPIAARSYTQVPLAARTYTLIPLEGTT